MEHTLEPDQYVLVDKLTPRFDAYKRGDIVVFKPPADWGQSDDTPFIKRVIGERRRHRRDPDDGLVYINGTASTSRTSTPRTRRRTRSRRPRRSTNRTWTVPEGELFLMGDHRAELGGLADVRTGPRRQRHRPRLAALLAARHVRHPPDADLPGAGLGQPMSRVAVNPTLAGVALAVIAGAVVAVSARDRRGPRSSGWPSS